MLRQAVTSLSVRRMPFHAARVKSDWNGFRLPNYAFICKKKYTYSLSGSVAAHRPYKRRKPRVTAYLAVSISIIQRERVY